VIAAVYVPLWQAAGLVALVVLALGFIPRRRKR
jgi:hypothetical protein